MKCRSLALGGIALLAVNAANVANAGVVFDNVTGVPSTGFSGPSDGGPTLTMGASFTAATPDFSSISLLLAAGSSSTTGSTLLYLVPDTGGGSGNGQSGLPAIEDNTGTFTSLAGSHLIGTISDTALTSSFGLKSFWVSPALLTTNQEYWVVAISDASSSFEWSYAGDDSGVGTGGQSYFNDFAGSNLLPTSDSSGGYQMVVETPEPAAIAILGSGLVGLGFFRRRTARPAV